MSEDVEKPLVRKLKTRNFSVQMDESTFRHSEDVFIAHIRYVDEYNFAEDMLFSTEKLL